MCIRDRIKSASYLMQSFERKFKKASVLLFSLGSRCKSEIKPSISIDDNVFRNYGKGNKKSRIKE